MKKDEHIKLVDLINFSKGIYGKSEEEADKEREFERIVLHLGSCPSCMDLLKDIEYVRSNFDEVWDTIFPIESKAAVRILRWITELRENLSKEFRLIINNIENTLQEKSQNITEQVIPVILTTHGVSKTGKKTFYFLNPEDAYLFDRIELQDNNLIFHSSSDPGYRNLIIIGPDNFFKKTQIREFGPSDFYAKFSNLELTYERCLIHLY
ncbi:MAG: hypothetical protein JXR52_08685 [Bacteroidales bacterium]|nr:hypothetical protein [Bacteroidales bacterium]MBN2698888.1 hypothetical protein [Bacteroidales bacterium]